MTPDDSEVSGTIVAQTSLKMSRLFNYQDYIFEPSEDNSNLTQTIDYEHIPIGGASGDVAYMLELCAAERLLPPSELENAPEDVDWSFAIDVEGVTKNLT